MKNLWTSLGCLFLSVLILACSGSGSKSQEETKTSAVVRLLGAEVYGDARNYFALVPDDYKVNVKDGKVRLKLRLQLLRSIGEDEKIKDAPMLAFLDEDGAQIDINAYGVLSNEEMFLSFLRSEVGTVSDILFVNDDMSHEECQNLLSTVESVSIDGLSFSNPLGDLLEETAKQAEQIDEASLEQAVEVSKAALEAGKSAIDMLNELDNLMK